MSNDQEAQERRAGCPPHEFGNALAWRWTREMPPGLKGGFLTLLYALRAMASASGYLRFSGDGKPIRIQDIAKAAGSREKDARRYLEAAIRAGVVGVVGERRRGRAALYVLVLNPCPAWGAAAGYLKETARPRKTDQAPEDATGSSGRRGPNSKGEKNGPQRPELRGGSTEEVRATAARMGSGHGGPIGSGHSGPNNPGSNQALPQEVVDVVPQPPVCAGARGESDQSSDQVEGDRPFRRCRCGIPLLRPTKDLCGRCEQDEAGVPQKGDQKPVQGAFLTPMPSGTRPARPGAPGTPSWQQQDPAAPLRVCGCGREYRDRHPGGVCLDCQMAAFVDHPQPGRGVSGA
ncbi:hypothetical protein AB0D24_04900 [Streptomyces javensis]|uniref:hypothetical protein n=1 Tax=Streptomyces javensis TaxID=114698 RepID=UPI0033E6B941